MQVLYDAGCGLCAPFARFAMRRDRKRRLEFVPLDSTEGRALRKKLDIPAELDSVILIAEGRIVRRSTAILAILRSLGFPWSLAAALLLVPRVLRDALYDIVARHRSRWFGRCDIPSQRRSS